MVRAGAGHLDSPKDLIEEVMYEKMLETRFRLNKALPLIAVSAACAPLLGLLGTVTGIISTFKLITVFGSGDVKMLSAGISEALITTEYGLYVAIPSILAHSFLSRKVKAILDRMERVGIEFLTEVEKARQAGGGAA
jgi:biopolymer transport protein ExbB